MVNRLPLGLVALICMIALSATGTTVPVSHAATATSFTFSVGGDHGASLTAGDTAASLSRLAASGSDFYLAIGDLSYDGAIDGTNWCSQFKGSYNNVEVLAGNHDTGEENSTAQATRSYERYVNGCPYTLTPSPLSCGPVLLNCYGKEYYFDYPAVNPIARFIMISPVVYNVTGVCTPLTTIRCNASWPGTTCTDTFGCWGYNFGDPHYSWVSSTIDSARASSTIKWILVGMHKVCISAGDQTCNIGPDLLNLMISKKVDLILEGHDHSYQRSKQLAFNTSTCTKITTSNSYATYNPNCIVNDGSAGVYTPGAGTVVVIQGTFGAPFNTVNDTSLGGCSPCAAEAPYFTKLMGTNTPGNGHGFMQYTVSASRIDAKSSFSGSFQDSFTIGQAFTMSSSPTSLVLQVGASSSSTITVTSQAGFTGIVSLGLTASGCACASPMITPGSVDLTAQNPTATASLQVTGLSPGGNVTLTVTGTSGTLSFSAQVAVSVQDFSISASKPALTLNFNASDTSTINLASLNNFAGTITLSPTSSPSGLTFSISPSSIPIASKSSGSATLSVTGSAPGNYTVAVGATSGPTSHATIVKVRVLGDFTMSTTKTALTLSPGTIDSSIIITLIGSGKYSGTVNLAASVTPSGPTATPGSSSLKLKATPTNDGTNSTVLTVNAGMISGTYSINITATSGLLFHSTIVTLTVTKANPTIGTTLSASSISAGGSVSDSAVLTGATTTAGGTVTYSVFSGAICSGTPVFAQAVPVTNGIVPSSRAVQFNVTGSYVWQATYTGDPNNNPPQPTTCGSEALTVKQTATTVGTNLSALSIVPGGVVSDSATLTGFFGGFSTGGTATYSVFAGTGCTGTLVFTQTVSVNSVSGAIPNSRNVQFNATGTFQWLVIYSGDSNNGLSTSLCGSESLSIGKATPSITTSLSPNSVVVGNSASDTATVTGGTAPTGTVTFNVYLGSACSGTAVATKTVPLASGSAGPVSVVFNSTGTFNWQAVYSGDASNGVATSVCGTETLTVALASPAIAETVSATTIIVGNSANANATLSGGFNPTGTVTLGIFSGTGCPGSPVKSKTFTLVSSSVGPFSVIFNSTGTFNWQAAYSGDANNNPNASSCQSLIVNKTTPAIATTLSQSSLTVGGSVSDSASISNGFQASGTVTYKFFAGSSCTGTGTQVGSPVTVTSGVVPNSNSQPFNAAGLYSWNAAYSGDANNSLATSPCEPLTISKTNPTIATVLSQNPITVGNSATDSATLTNFFQAGGTVTYSFFSGSACGGTATVVGSPVAVSNGIVPNSASQTFNAAGPYSWNAAYSGDTNNNVVTSVCEPLTVNPKGVTIATTLSSTTITVGSSVFDSATITGATTTAGGTVTYNLFTGGTCSGSASPVSTVTVTNGVVPNSSPQTFSSIGMYSWNAIYSGDPNNSGAPSPCEPLSVSKTSPTITTSLSSNSIIVGQPVTESATLTGGFQAGGSVSYLEFSSSTCSGSSTVASTVTVTSNVIPSSSPINPVPSGTYGFEASYSGDANNNPIVSSCSSLTVNKASPTITTSLSQTTIPVGSSVTDSVTMTGGYQPSGTVAYSYFTGSSCTGTATSVGSPVTVTNGVVPGSSSQGFNSAGSYGWNAAYSGDANNNPITSACEPLTVSKAGPTLTTALSANPITVGGSVSDFATMNGGFQAGGSATYFLFSTADCTGSKIQVSIVTVSNGVIPNSVSQTFNSAGLASWNLGYSGDSNNNPTTSPCELLTVSKASPTISTTLSLSVITVGGSVSDSATMTNGFQASGTVTYSFFSGSTCAGPATIVGSPVTVAGGIVPNSASQTFNAAGPYSWNGVYTGDANNNAATSTCEPLTVNPKGVAITTNLSSTTIVVGNSASDSAVLTGATTNAGGTVTYNLFLNGICSGTSSIISQVTVASSTVPNSRTVIFNSTTAFSWNAGYSGDANNAPATSLCEPLTIQKASPTLSTTVSAPSGTVGSAFHDSSTMTGSYNAGGTVSYSIFSNNACSGNATPVGNPVIVAGGTAPDSVSVTPSPAGPYSFQASYSGDANNNAVSSGCEPFSVTKASPTISTALATNPIAVGGSTSDSATVTGGFSPSGTVTYSYFQGSVCAGPGTTVGLPVTMTSGLVPSSPSQTFSSAGPYSWNAVYNGDSNNNAVASACELLTVNKASPVISTTLSTNPITVGGSVSDSATMTGGFQAGGTVTYNWFTGNTCSGAANVVSTVALVGGGIPSSAARAFNSAGPYSWNAVYGGDANNNLATSPCEPLTVNPTTGITVSTTLSSSSITVGGSVSDSATLTGVTSGAGGTVTYNSFQTATCTGTPGAVSTTTVTNGVVPGSASKTYSSAGSFSWNAIYSGDANNGGATSLCEPLNVNQAVPSITTTVSIANVPVGTPVHDSATLSNGFNAGGSVTYTLFSDTGCTASGVVISTVTVTNGVVPDSSATSPTPAGAYGFQASYAGDANNKPAISVCEPFNVLKASPGITTTLSLTTIPVGSSVSDSATMTGGYQPSGTVTYVFFIGSSCTGSPTTVGSPVAVTNGIVPGSAPQTFNNAGGYGWSVVYSGDANNNPVTGSCEPLTVNKANPAISTALSANPITVGGSVYDSATMTGAFQAGGSATYFWFTTGDCTGSSATVSTVTVNNGAIPSSSPQLFSSAGSFSWNARYFGDSNNNPATSPCEPLTVNKASPTISTSLSANPVTVGSSVSDFATMTGGFQPGGSATYFLFSTADCTGLKSQVSVVTVNNGVIPSSIPQTFNTAGLYSLNAGYSGDANNNASTSPCELLTVNKASPAISTNLSQTTIVVGNPVSDSATITNSFLASGTVTFSFYTGPTCAGTATVVGTPVTVTNGIVPSSSSQTFSAAGAFSWNAAYSGDANNNPVTSPCEPLTVNPKGVAIGTSLSSTAIIVGGSAFDSAVLTGATSNAGGTVTYNLFSSGICSASPASISKVTVTSSTIPNSRSVIFNNTSPVSWNAVYSGDPNNAPATSLCEPLTVNKANPTLATTVSVASATIGSAFHDSATLAGAYNAGGTVSYSVFSNNACSGNSTPVGNPVNVAGGVVADSAPVTPSTAGPYSFQASYSGDANNNGASGTCEPFAVNKASPSITTTLSANSIPVGGSAFDSASIAGGFNLGGTVTYSYFQNSNCVAPSTIVGSPVTITNGVVPSSPSQTFSPAGQYSWNAVYNGDPNNNGNASPCEPLTVNKANPTITTALSQNPITVGGLVFDSATIASGFQAGGSVTYNWFTGVACNGALTVLPSVTVVSGQVPNSVSQVFNSAGPYSWSAIYSGDTSNNGATSACEPLTVNPTSGVVIFTVLSSSSITVGGSVTDSATLTGVTSGAGGTVTYNWFQTASCAGPSGIVSIVTVVNGNVPGSASKAFNTAGSFSWNALYSGDSNNSVASSNCEPLTVSKTSPSIFTSLSTNLITVGQSITQSAGLTGSFQAGGSVTYLEFSTGTCSGTGVMVSSVTVTNNVIPSSPQITPVPSGTYGFEASYSGDTNNNPITSSCSPLTVNKASPTITTSLSSNVVAIGSPVYDSASITGGFQVSGTVTYIFYTGNSCSGVQTATSTVTVTSNGIPSSSPATPDSLGSWSWKAAYSGDANNLGSSNCAGLVVTKTTPTIASNLAFPTISAGDSIHDSSTMSGGFLAGGTVTYSFYTGSTCSGSGTVVGSPVAVTNGIVPDSASQSFATAGTYGWNAVYSGDSNNNQATSPCELLTVVQAVSSLTLPQVGAITVGNSLSLSATLLGTTGNAGGTVTYNLYTTANCQGTAIPVQTVPVTSGSAQPSRAYQFTSAGSFGWNAVYSGDPNNGHATSSCGPLLVNKATPTVSTTLSANVITKGDVVSGSATLTGGFAAGGTLTYNQFSSSDCTGNPTIVATVTVNNSVVPSSSSQTFATDGKFSWNVTYSGDNNNTPAKGSCRVLTVTAPPLLSVPGPMSVNSGSPIRFTVNATDPSWNNITITASGLPSGSTFPGAQSLTGKASALFSWTPSDSQASADYKVTFTVDDGHGGKTNSPVTIHVNGINRSSSLNNAIPYFVIALVAGTAIVLAAPLLLRRFRK
ncbi:MAG TPA: hypothetical protein VGS11_10010 [Candidatus Bathyarchaeia archaeon]|nr:hypothetical protein [Candidatus Bathyarchaeia archaeon]